MFTAPTAEPKEPETVRALRLRAQAAGLAEGTPQYNDFMLNGGVERTETPPSGYRYDAARNLEAIPGGPADPARPSRGAAPTEGERKAAGFLYRMEDAERVLSEIPVEKQNPNIAQRLASSVVPEGWVLGENEEVARQAQVDWIRAKLRFESGAVIGEDEAFQEAAAYFPRPGDSEARIKAKARSRQNALEQLRIAAGRSSVSNEAPADPSAQAVPQEIMDQLQGAPAGTTVLSPDGRTLTWDGQALH